LQTVFQTGRMKRLVSFAACNIIVIFALMWVAAKKDLPANGFYYAAFVTGTLTILAFLLIKYRKFSGAIVSYSFISVGFFVVFYVFFFPYMKWEDSKRLSVSVLPQLNANEKLVIHNAYDYVPVFYTNARIELMPDGHLLNLGSYAELTN